jgi:hypothetical protein
VPDAQTAAAGTAIYASTANPITPRTRDEVLAFFDGLEILEPGLVPVQWRPDEPSPADTAQGLALRGLLGGAGRILTDRQGPHRRRAQVPESHERSCAADQ